MGRSPSPGEGEVTLSFTPKRAREFIGVLDRLSVKGLPSMELLVQVVKALHKGIQRAEEEAATAEKSKQETKK